MVMNNLRNYIEQKRGGGEKILSVYLTAGFPHPAATLPLLESIAGAGADLIELGVPFSDPLADGRTIQDASQKALAAGITLAEVLEILRSFKKTHPVPVLLMGYANPFLQFGWDNLIREAKSAGASGFIIPDLPPEESGEILQKMKGEGLHLIYLVSPNTPAERVALINDLSSGFIYAVSITGVTGARDSLPEASTLFLENLRRQTQLPVLAGFGISSAETAWQMSRYGDGVIIGSAVIDRIAGAGNLQKARKSVSGFLREIKNAMQN
jgi:tryptophan synthase alpha chain